MPLMQIELDHNSNNNNSGHNLSDIKLLIFIKFIQLPHEVVPIIVPSLQMGKLRLGEERSLAEGHATRRSVAGFGLDPRFLVSKPELLINGLFCLPRGVHEQNQDLNPGLLTLSSFD